MKDRTFLEWRRKGDASSSSADFIHPHRSFNVSRSSVKCIIPSIIHPSSEDSLMNKSTGDGPTVIVVGNSHAGLQSAYIRHCMPAWVDKLHLRLEGILFPLDRFTVTCVWCSLCLQTLKNSKSLCSLDDEELHMRTIVSSPCGSADDLVNITPGSSPVRELLEVSASQRGPDPQHDPLRLPPQRPGFSWAVVAGESDEDISDTDSIEERIFPLYCGDLDLEQIEKN